MEAITAVRANLEVANGLLRRMLEQVVAEGGITKEQYARYLAVQYYLTNGVQRHFMVAASHPKFAGCRKFRDFLYKFAIEEEPHYKMAESDVRNLGQAMPPEPLDVKLWWLFFNSIIHERPLVRLGATCVLENFGSGASDIIKPMLANAKFINERTSTFIVLHMHEEVKHGDQILEAISWLKLSDEDIADLEIGSEIGATIFLRMLGWAFNQDPILQMFAKAKEPISVQALERRITSLSKD
ncbi:MAG TPA: hypothetical protein V6C84_24590 [Coleofasciculaceae cyanobacterium]|jgi:hypothetical protein